MTGFYIQTVENDADWQAVRSIRTEVFIVEQDCPPPEEWDEFDESSTHFLAKHGRHPIGAARMREITLSGKPAAKLERFAILRPWRGQGLGKRLVEEVMGLAISQGYDQLYLHAQAHLEDLYASMGFIPRGERFYEAGIPHVAMSLTVDPDGQTTEDV